MRADERGWRLMNVNDPRLLRLDQEDNVLVAIVTIPAGTVLTVAGQPVTAAAEIPLGFKVAVRAIAAGEKILKYRAAIGSATRDIAPGEVVHLHNMKSDYLPTYERGEGAAHAGH
jgi:altronate dehydratase small subunit